MQVSVVPLRNHHQQQMHTKLVEEDETSVTTMSSFISSETLSSFVSSSSMIAEEQQDESLSKCTAPQHEEELKEKMTLPNLESVSEAAAVVNQMEKLSDITVASTPPSSEGDEEEVLEEEDVLEEEEEHASDSQEEKSSRNRRRVTFNSVEIREYPRCLGNNPSVRSGPPVSIEWDYCRSYKVDMQFYESDRYLFEKDSPQDSSSSSEEPKTSDDDDGNYHRERKNTIELQLDAQKRYQILMEECCVSRSEIQDCLAIVRKDKENRRVSLAFHQQFEHIIIPYESAVRKLKRWKGKIGKKKTASAA